MSQTKKRSFVRSLFLLAIGLLTTQSFAANVILMIGDGMGDVHVDVAAIYANGTSGTLHMEKMPVHGWSRTNSMTVGTATDSAAGGTALATGHKVDNDVVSVALPGDGSPLTTIMELAKNAGMSIGMITTSYVVDATPASFGSHTSHRGNLAPISTQILNQTRPNVLFGGGNAALTDAIAAAAGYTMGADRDQVLALTGAPDDAPVAAIFGTDRMPYEHAGLGNLPHLHEMTSVALDRLSRNPKGFFVMIEGGRIDHASHSNLLPEMIDEALELDRTVKTVQDWVANHPDTLLIVTADHETGDLSLLANNGQGQLPTIKWGSTKHTSDNVPVFAQGINSDKLAGTYENTHIFDVMKEALEKPANQPTAVQAMLTTSYR